MNGTCHCGVSISSFTGTRRGLWSAIVVFVAGCVRFGRMDEGARSKLPRAWIKPWRTSGGTNRWHSIVARLAVVQPIGRASVWVTHLIWPYTWRCVFLQRFAKFRYAILTGLTHGRFWINLYVTIACHGGPSDLSANQALMQVVTGPSDAPSFYMPFDDDDTCISVG